MNSIKMLSGIPKDVRIAAHKVREQIHQRGERQHQDQILELKDRET